MRNFVALPHLLLLLLASGCGGTEAGNPALTSPATPNSTRIIAANEILREMCDKLTSCFPSLTDSSCRAGILASSGIDTKLGLPAGFGTYQSIVQADTMGTLRVNIQPMMQCQVDVHNLSCASASVTSAYSAAAPSDFTHVSSLLSSSTASCSGVYTP